MGWKGAIVGGALGYIAGLFFKGAIGAFFGFALTKNLPTLGQFLSSTFIPSAGFSSPDFLRYFTVPLPFALLGAALGVLVFRRRTPARAGASVEVASSQNA